MSKRMVLIINIVKITLFESSHRDTEILAPLQISVYANVDRLCGLVVRVLGYRSRGPASIPGTTRFSEK
jgi:hypothetical protein